MTADVARRTSIAGCAHHASASPSLSGIAMLDGFVAAVVAEASHLRAARLALLAARRERARHQRCNDTEKYPPRSPPPPSIPSTAVAMALGRAPGRFTPIFGRDAHGAIDVGPWCRGFRTAIQLNPKFWQKLLPARGLAHRWLIPILAHCHRRRRPARSAARHRTVLSPNWRKFDAHRTIQRRCRCHPPVLGSTRYKVSNA